MPLCILPCSLFCMFVDLRFLDVHATFAYLRPPQNLHSCIWLGKKGLFSAFTALCWLFSGTFPPAIRQQTPSKSLPNRQLHATNVPLVCCLLGSMAWRYESKHAEVKNGPNQHYIAIVLMNKNSDFHHTCQAKIATYRTWLELTEKEPM